MNMPDRDTVRGVVERHRDDIIEWTRKFIRYKSENRPPNGAEGEAQEFIKAECEALGMDTDLFSPEEVEGIRSHPSWLEGRDYSSGRKNLAATWRGKGGGRSILFSGHTDVAPFEPDNWTVCRPYEPVVKNGRLYGRGSCDMKGGIAAAFWALKILKELEWEPSGDVIFETVVDEEFAGGNGTLASRLKGYNADLAVLAEPTRMEVCPASLGAFLGDLVIEGKGGMPYMGTAIPNPISAASRVIDLFRRYEKEWRRAHNHPLFTGPGKELNVILWSIDSRKEDEFTQLGTPLFTRLSWIIWCYPGMSEERFYREFRKFWNSYTKKDDLLKNFRIEIVPTYHYVKAWESDPKDPAVQAVVDAFRGYTGRDPGVGGASFSCDLALYGEVGGMPSVIIGPRGDNLHAPDEWVLIDDILSLAGTFAFLAGSWCGSL